ncbi:MAG TPA: ATP-dependent DNA helicase [Spirochaetia bacterium]|nr:ATP-dependent DNA helicase [Spirochaetia bacterium]
MPNSTPEFDLAYKKLNDAQRQAVDTIEGPVLVLAGPGTGKTQVLTTRIANILKETDTDPSSILALTFTEAATKEMRTRLINLIGKDGYLVQVTTFHSFCADVIAQNPERFSKPAGMQNVTDLEKIQIIQEILEQGNFALLKPIGDPLFYLPYILNSISDLKREGFTIEKYSQLVSLLKDEFELEKDDLSKTARIEKEKLVSKNLDLLDIYENYQNKLTTLGRFDFNDMINWVVEAFEKDPDFLLGYQEKFQYLLVDEYQDTNSAQNRLIFALASYWGEQANIFAVGDPNQSIFRFQGASKENVREFEKAFPGHTKIVLDQSYRSTQTILDSAATLLGETPLHANTELKDEKIKTVEFSSTVLEDEFITSDIQEKIKKGASPKDFAVIVKENKDVDILVNLFKQKNIPYHLEGGTNILATPLVSQFLKILKVATTLHNKVDDLDLFTVLNFPYFHLNPLSILKISRQAHQERKTLVDSLQSDHPELDEKVVEAYLLFVSWNSKAATHTLPEMFQMILQESGLLEYILALPQPIIELNRFGTLFDDVKSQSTSFPDLDLFGYVYNLQIMEENNLKLEEQVLIGNDDAVTLTTAHKSKGLEWNTVYIYRFADTHWGNKAKREMIKLPDGIIVYEDTDKEDKNAEERRLFYVAATRAKQELFLTGSTQYENSAKMIFPAMFLEDLPKENIEKVDTKKIENSAHILATLMSPAKEETLLDGEAEYLKEIIKDLKLSPTALNTYLRCHYKFKLDNLYRIPRSKAPAMCFGTAVHYALEQLFRELNNGKLESKEIFLKDFEAALQREIMTETDFKDRLAHGKKVLTNYYDKYEKEFTACLFTEKSFGTSLTSQIHLGDSALTGKVDRIEVTNEKEKHVRVIDYKTGKPKTRNEIEGNTKNSDGDYKRQLTFYQLLSELDKSFQYEVKETQIDFIEPDAQNNFHRENFIISPEDVTELKKVIKTSVSQIRDLDFTRTEDLTKCSTCPFKSHCQR